MLAGAEAIEAPTGRHHQSLVWFSDDGKTWTPQHDVGDPDNWLWRITWHKDHAYGFGYGCGNDNRSLRLFRSSDGNTFETLIDKVNVEGTYPNETSIVFLPDDTAYCLLRQDGEPKSGYLGTSHPPYTAWNWKSLGVRLGGPDMIRLPDGQIIAVVRLYDAPVRTSVCWLDPEKGTLTEALKLPSGGDTSYAGLVWHDDLLWISYYSSHEDKTSIYLAKVRIGSEAVRTDERPQPALRTTHANVRYGEHERNVLDFYQALSDKPTPLAVYIHGGGFVGGDKTVPPAQLKGFLDAGISVAAIRYRFVDGKDIIFPAPQHDGARAVQFLRSKAKEWNIDSDRVACYGGSAGAGISMWIGFHEDLADPTSDDPILRESTRIQAIGTFGGQSTYDPIKIRELIGGRAWEHPSIFRIYGITTADEALHPTPEKQKLYDESSAFTHLTPDDPPLYMVYSEADGPLPPDARPGQGIHHPNFGRHLKTRMDELQIENVFVYTPAEKSRDVNAEMLEFFRKQFENVKVK